MPITTIRHLPCAAQQAIKVRTARHGRSAEAEINTMLEDAVHSGECLLVGKALAELGREAGMTNADVDAFERNRDTTPAVPLDL
ncbi:plasmid stabilization protein [Stenotrophomonas sp. CFBP 13725]|uniref:FitA-like ribbon-helix-helix domain-containing protein n=1 Tax=Stenotrophomonas sp. CFBP 13725 TaxID=2775297 RepID=UPI0017871658|nr:plasmid stabilization protein [Stenotrophomonas sp. CFBP 13725]MBD8634721.1 plasmid stabilization protein [Stenotrophomonas sp. CFBP 13725]